MTSCFFFNAEQNNKRSPVLYANLELKQFENALCFFFIIIIIISEGCGNSTLSSCGPLKAVADCILSHLSLHGKTTTKESIMWGRKFKGETLVTFSALKWTQLQMQWGFNILSDRKMLNKHPKKTEQRPAERE